jgi:hypothetical protein
MRSALIRELNVVGLMPSSCAAPVPPATRQPVASRAASKLARSNSSSSFAVRTRFGASAEDAASAPTEEA